MLLAGGKRMERTTIMLPHDLKLRAAQQAKKKGISMGKLIREAIYHALSQDVDKSSNDDPLFTDNELYLGPAPADLSADHDQYLYGEK
jgi:hypothetical protein